MQLEQRCETCLYYKNPACPLAKHQLSKDGHCSKWTQHPLDWVKKAKLAIEAIEKVWSK